MRNVLTRQATAELQYEEVQLGRELRSAPRFTLLIRAAKLISPQGEFMCIVRDASETGVNIRLFHDLPDCGEMMLEMQNGDRHELELVWQEGDRAGLKFLRAADISRIVECSGQFSKRPIRINLDTCAQLAWAGECASVRLHDLSQQGAKFSGETHFSIDQRVRLSARGLPEINAKIRWRRDASYGLVFEDTFQFGDLARIVARMQLDKAP